MNKKTWIILIVAIVIVAILAYVFISTGEVIWDKDKCRIGDARCTYGGADCDSDANCLTGYCEGDNKITQQFGLPNRAEVCICPNGQAWNGETLTCYTCPAGKIIEVTTGECVSAV